MKFGMPIAKGNTASIYLCDNKIVKIFNGNLPPNESIYEANKQKLIYNLGLPVPKIFDVTHINGKQAIIMEYVKGETLGELILNNKEKCEYYMNISIDIQCKIHSVYVQKLELMADKLTRQIKGASLLDAHYKQELIKSLDNMVFDEKLCHGDYHVFNLIMKENEEVVIIDWVDSSLGDIRADVCRSYILYQGYSQELADMYIELYCEKTKISKKEIFLWSPIITGAKLSEKVQMIINTVAPNSQLKYYN